MAGITVMQVTVDQVIPSRGIAVCKEASTSKSIEIRLLPMRAGRMPVVGERWLVDRTYDAWTFAALLTSPTMFSGSGTNADDVNALITTALAGLANAYDVAVANGFVGTQAAWLASLVGEPGTDSTVAGPAGPANSLSIGTVTSGPADADITGTAPTQFLHLVLPPGADGLSAYQVALANGFVGTQAAWLTSLEGIDGTDGDSAYQVALANGFVGTQVDWLASLDGADGGSAYAVAVANGFVGTEVAWLASLAGADGDPGLSAYQVAVANGFVGTQVDWLTSLEGIDGTDGDSAYQVAVNNGFVGTQSAWLTSLVGGVGDNGLTAYQVAVANGFVGTEAVWLASLVGAAGADGTFAYIGTTPPPGSPGTWVIDQLWVDTGSTA